MADAETPLINLSWQGAATSTRLPLKVMRSSRIDSIWPLSSGEPVAMAFTYPSSNPACSREFAMLTTQRALRPAT
jgi:hypothetical protein